MCKVITVKKKREGYDPKKSFTKGAVLAILIMSFDVITNMTLHSENPMLDMSLRSIIIGSIMIAINYIKNRGR